MVLSLAELSGAFSGVKAVGGSVLGSMLLALLAEVDASIRRS